MKPIYFILIIFTISVRISAQDVMVENKIKSLCIGEKIELQSEILNETRTINVYLPNGYSKDSLKIYPVIYLLDGGMEEDFIHISGLVQFGSFSWINMIPESIVVGISNVDRKRDFTFPTNNSEHKKKFETSGQSEGFINFIEKELQPLIKEKYKTDSITTIIGQSLGGLLAVEILFKKPDLFDNYIIISPSLWWNDKSLFSYKPKTYSSRKSIFIGVGKEGQDMEIMAEKLYYKLKPLNIKNTNIFFKYYEELDHGDVLHQATYKAFELIFKEQ